ncbi:hypothetical protein [Enterococcus faecium]|uniref:hypothetical protein n=1 Tax=Enterococcus faecium TaxID=1352 RepID=UPI0006B2621D|nr:hypothetical protein [Enterococcus faecium]OUZ28018.1 hypothetical protein A5806_002627 [Enterococcus faecium]
MCNKEKIHINKIYKSKVIGKIGIYKVRIRRILERTAVVELVDMDDIPALIKIEDLIDIN